MSAMMVPAQSLTPLQLYAAARRLVGPFLLPMRQGERPESVTMGPEAVTVVLSVETWRDVRGGVKVTHRGTKILLVTLNKYTGKWECEVLLDELKKLDSPLYMLSEVEPEADQLARRQHEQMCYRPGNSRYPLDGPGRFEARSQ